MACGDNINRQLGKATMRYEQNAKEEKQKPIKALIINNHSNFIQKIIYILEDFEIEYSVIDYIDFRLEKSSSFDFFILSGGDIKIRDNPSLQQEEELIRQAPKPIFGICAGFQIIAKVFGESISELPEQVYGVKKIKVFNLDKLGINYTFNELDVFEYHSWAVKTPVKNFTVFGSSEYGIEIIKHNSKPILTTQFHPEVQENNKGIIILNYFIEKMVLNKNNNSNFSK
jgi:GMP synthase-like glutamine amidotransferase